MHAIQKHIGRRAGLKSVPPALAILVAALVASLSGCNAPVLTVDDTVVHDNGKSRLVARLEREWFLGLRSDLEDTCVRFYVDSRPIGAACTDEDGEARLEYSLPPGAQTYEARVALPLQDLRATGAVYHWTQDRIIIAVDIDETLAHTDLDELILHDVDLGSQPIPGALETLRQAARDYDILYLSNRPRFLSDKTKRWLHQHEFPDGPVFVAHGLREAANGADYKRATLHELRQRWPRLLIGVGNRRGDALAYAANGMLPIMITHERPQRFHSHAVVLPDWSGARAFFNAHREQLTSPTILQQLATIPQADREEFRMKNEE